MTEYSHVPHTLFDALDAVNDPPTGVVSSDSADALADFLEVVALHERRVTSVVSRFLDDPRDVEEAVQDTFLQAWRHRGQFRHDAAVFTWLYRIATNTALMRLRRRRTPLVSLDEVSSRDQRAFSHDPLAEHPETLDTVDTVRAALAELPEHHRLVVMLRDVEGFSNAEVADLLGLPVTTIKAHLHRGRVALRKSRRDHLDRRAPTTPSPLLLGAGAKPVVWALPQAAPADG